MSTPAPTPGRRPRRLWLRALGSLLVLAAVAAGSVAWAVIHALGPRAEAAAPVRFDVPPGATLRSVAEELEARGVIRSALALRGIAIWLGTAVRMQVCV
jgi:cell division protein YceG involved in septum cleavage